MTHFFIRFIGLFTCIVLMLIFGTRLVGSLRPPLPLGTFMTSPDGTACDHPCLFGVYPGVTTIEQAKQLLDSHPLTHGGMWINARPLLLLSDKKSYVALGSTEDNRVDNIIFTDAPYDSGVPVPDAIVDTMQLGEIILSYGKPVIGLPGSNYVVVEYPNMGIVAAYARPSNLKKFVLPTNAMSMIMLSDLSPCPNPFTLALNNWMGFTKLTKYYQTKPTANVAYRNSTIVYPPPYLHCAAQPMH